jgi:hypothetical protein
MLPALALLLLAAHLLYNGSPLLAALALGTVALLGLRRPWAGRLLQFVLLAASIEWVLTALELAQTRMAHGAPYLRLVVILGAVAVFTALSALAFQAPRPKSWFRLGAGRPSPSGAMPD